MTTLNGKNIISTHGPVPAVADYPEQYAKPYKIQNNAQKPRNTYKGSNSNSYQLYKQEFNQLLTSGVVPRCTAGFVKGVCGNGHTFYKGVFCGREYCPDCGRNGSLSHQRRVIRWNPKAQEMNSLRYLVITVPESVRPKFMHTEVLRGFRVAVKRKLKRMGNERGLMRYHFFGDCPACDGAGCRTCKGTGAGTKFHPHLNILMEGGFMSPADFKLFRTELNAFLVRYFKSLTGKVVNPVFHLQYAVTPEDKAHKVKYVTRSTFRIFDHAAARVLKGFRSSQVWGQWPDHCKSEYNPREAEVLEHGNCPCCKKEGEREFVNWKQGGNFTKELLPNSVSVEGVQFIKRFIDSTDEEKSPPGKVVRSLYRHSELMAAGVSLYHIEAGYYHAEDPDHYTNLKLLIKSDMSSIVVDTSLINQLAELRHLQKLYKRSPTVHYANQIKRLEASIDGFISHQVADGVCIDPSKVWHTSKPKNNQQDLW